MSIPPKKYPNIIEKNLFVNYCTGNTVSEEIYHSHTSHYELCFVLQGNYQYYFNYEEISASAFDVVLITPQTPHKSETSSENAMRVIINFNDAFLSEIGAYYINISEIFSNEMINISEEFISDFNAVLSKLVFENDYPSVFSEKLSNNYMFEIFVMLQRLVNKDVSTRSLPINPIIEAATKYICDNYSHELPLDDIADYCHVSNSYLSRLFKEIMGININAYINSIRIHQALRLLKNTNMTILEISEACGYNGIKHFCSTFKKQQGVTAHEFRKKTQAQFKYSSSEE